MNSSAIRWGLVTFCVGITCVILGHYLQDADVFIAAPFIAFVGSMIGACCIMSNSNE